jgi:hypothetical protein
VPVTVAAWGAPLLAEGLGGLGVAELVVAAVLVLLGVRSLVRWLRVRPPYASAGRALLYALHVTARVGLWFAFALFFLGSALVDEPQRLRWYVLVLIGLAGIQLVTALALWLAPSEPGAAGWTGGARMPEDMRRRRREGLRPGRPGGPADPDGGEIDERAGRELRGGHPPAVPRQGP